MCRLPPGAPGRDSREPTDLSRPRRAVGAVGREAVSDRPGSSSIGTPSRPQPQGVAGEPARGIREHLCRGCRWFRGHELPKETLQDPGLLGLLKDWLRSLGSSDVAEISVRSIYPRGACRFVLALLFRPGPRRVRADDAVHVRSAAVPNWSGLTRLCNSYQPVHVLSAMAPQTHCLRVT